MSTSWHKVYSSKQRKRTNVYYDGETIGLGPYNMTGECLMSSHYRITDTSYTGLALPKYYRKNIETLETQTGANSGVNYGALELSLVQN